jgi:hypothetical protein
MPNTTMLKNMVFCKSCTIPGWRCRGKCKYAHSIKEVNPIACKRFPVCRCRWREKPRRCSFIHKDESKEQYAERMGFCKESSGVHNSGYDSEESEAERKRSWIENIRCWEPRLKNYTYEQMEDAYEEEMHEMAKEMRKMEEYEYECEDRRQRN